MIWVRYARDFGQWNCLVLIGLGASRVNYEIWQKDPGTCPTCCFALRKSKLQYQSGRLDVTNSRVQRTIQKTGDWNFLC